MLLIVNMAGKNKVGTGGGEGFRDRIAIFQLQNLKAQ